MLLDGTPHPPPLCTLVSSCGCAVAEVLRRADDRAAAAPAARSSCACPASWASGFHKWGYPQMDALVENLFIKAWFRGTPILGNLHVFRWKMFMLVAFFRIKLLVQFKPWQEYRDPAGYIASSQPLSAMLKKKYVGKWYGKQSFYYEHTCMVKNRWLKHKVKLYKQHCALKSQPCDCKQTVCISLLCTNNVIVDMTETYGTLPIRMNMIVTVWGIIWQQWATISNIYCHDSESLISTGYHGGNVLFAVLFHENGFMDTCWWLYKQKKKATGEWKLNFNQYQEIDMAIYSRPMQARHERLW